MTPDTPEEVVLWGAAGQAKVLRECLRHAGRRVVALFDNDPGAAPPFPDVPLYHGRAGFEAWLAARGAGGLPGFLAAVGGDKGAARLEIHDYLAAHGLPPASAVHPAAFVALDAEVGEGAQILAQAAVCAGAALGRQCIVNTAASVDHECRLAEGVHVAPGARLAGCVAVGRCAFVGMGALVLPRLRVGEGAVVGAGAVVTRDVPPRAVVVGSPARVVRTLPP